MEEFKKRGLHIKYKKEIAEWLIYLDQQKFSRKLEKQILQEIERFMAGKKSTEELLEEIFKEPEWVIEIEKEFVSQNPDTHNLIEILNLP